MVASRSTMQKAASLSINILLFATCTKSRAGLRGSVPRRSDEWTGPRRHAPEGHARGGRNNERRDKNKCTHPGPSVDMQARGFIASEGDCCTCTWLLAPLLSISARATDRLEHVVESSRPNSTAIPFKHTHKRARTNAPPNRQRSQKGPSSGFPRRLLQPNRATAASSSRTHADTQAGNTGRHLPMKAFSSIPKKHGARRQRPADAIEKTRLGKRARLRAGVSLVSIFHQRETQMEERGGRHLTKTKKPTTA